MKGNLDPGAPIRRSSGQPFILRFAFTNPDLDTTIVSTINPAHLQTNRDILEQGPLPPDLYEEVEHRLAAAGSAPQAGGR